MNSTLQAPSLDNTPAVLSPTNPSSHFTIHNGGQQYQTQDPGGCPKYDGIVSTNRFTAIKERIFSNGSNTASQSSSTNSMNSEASYSVVTTLLDRRRAHADLISFSPEKPLATPGFNANMIHIGKDTAFHIPYVPSSPYLSDLRTIVFTASDPFESESNQSDPDDRHDRTLQVDESDENDPKFETPTTPNASFHNDHAYWSPNIPLSPPITSRILLKAIKQQISVAIGSSATMSTKTLNTSIQGLRDSIGELAAELGEQADTLDSLKGLRFELGESKDRIAILAKGLLELKYDVFTLDSFIRECCERMTGMNDVEEHSDGSSSGTDSSGRTIIMNRTREREDTPRKKTPDAQGSNDTDVEADDQTTAEAHGGIGAHVDDDEVQQNTIETEHENHDLQMSESSLADNPAQTYAPSQSNHPLQAKHSLHIRDPLQTDHTSQPFHFSQASHHPPANGFYKYVREWDDGGNGHGPSPNNVASEQREVAHGPQERPIFQGWYARQPGDHPNGNLKPRSMSAADMPYLSDTVPRHPSELVNRNDIDELRAGIATILEATTSLRHEFMGFDAFQGEVRSRLEQSSSNTAQLRDSMIPMHERMRHLSTQVDEGEVGLRWEINNLSRDYGEMREMTREAIVLFRQLSMAPPSFGVAVAGQGAAPDCMPQTGENEQGNGVVGKDSEIPSTPASTAFNKEDLVQIVCTLSDGLTMLSTELGRLRGLALLAAVLACVSAVALDLAREFWIVVLLWHLGRL